MKNKNKKITLWSIKYLKRDQAKGWFIGGVVLMKYNLNESVSQMSDMLILENVDPIIRLRNSRE